MGYELDADIARVEAGFRFIDARSAADSGITNVRNFPAAEYDLIGTRPQVKPIEMKPGALYQVPQQKIQK